MTKSKSKKGVGLKRLKRQTIFLILNVVVYPVLWVVLRLWPLTLRWRTIGVERIYQLVDGGGPLIFAFWHGDLLGIYWHGRQHAEARRIHIMTSPSRDGRFLGRLLCLMGYRTVAGSSASQSVSGLRALLDVLDRNDYVAIAVDGPRGPRHVMKNGPFFLAKHTGATLIPVVYHFEKKWTVGSWDRLEIPRPFSRIHARVLDTVFIPPDMPHDELVGEIKRNVNDAMRREKEHFRF